MQDAGCGMRDAGVTADQHLTMAASGLSERTEIWETIKGIQTVSSFNP